MQASLDWLSNENFVVGVLFIVIFIIFIINNKFCGDINKHVVSKQTINDIVIMQKVQGDEFIRQ